MRTTEFTDHDPQQFEDLQMIDLHSADTENANYTIQDFVYLLGPTYLLTDADQY